MGCDLTESTTRDATVSNGRDLARWSLFVFAVALAARALELWELSDLRYFDLKLGDGRVYHLWAQEIAAGDWVGDRVFYQAPLYPYFLAVVYRIGGESLLMLRLLQILLGAIGCALLVQAGWRLFSKPVGIVAGLGLALYPPALFADVSLQKSVLDLFFVCAMLAVLAELIVRSEPKRLSFVGLGLILGALVLTRENALVLALVLLAWMLLRASHPMRERLAWAGLFAGGMAVLLLPVAIRNYAVSGDFHLTTSQFGHNFYIGNNPSADGTYAPLIYARGEPLIERDDAVRLAAEALGHEPTFAEVSDFYSGLAFDYIRSQPLDWVALLGRKAMLTINRVEAVDTQGHYAFAEHSRVLRATDWLLHFGLFVPLAVLGAWITWSMRGRLWPVYALAGAYAATLLLFYIFGRYRLPLVPILLLFAAAAVTGLPAFLRTGGRKAVSGGLAATAVVAVMANWPLLDAAYMESVTRYNLGNELAGKGLLRHAIREYERAIELHADSALANNNLGVIQARQKRYGIAQRHFERALEIAPDYAEAHFNLARALVDSYEREAAIESFRRGLEIDSSRPDVLVEMGRALLAEGRRDEAMESFGAALSLDASNREARKELARMQGRGAAATQR